MPAEPVPILCVDDNELVCDALRTAMRSDRPGGQRFEWVGSIASADQLPETIARLRPALVVLDVDMPGRDPFDALAAAMAVEPGVRVVMYTGHVRRDLVERALEAGAWAYVSKNEPVAALLDALTRVHQGEVVLGPEAGAALGGPAG